MRLAAVLPGDSDAVALCELAPARFRARNRRRLDPRERDRIAHSIADDQVLAASSLHDAREVAHLGGGAERNSEAGDEE